MYQSNFPCQIGGLGDSRGKVLVFFKLYPTVITEKNLHQSLLVSSMLESPINTLYQAVRQVFVPVLLKVGLPLFTQAFNRCFMDAVYVPDPLLTHYLT